jgi:hypothetical protein
MKQQLTLRFWLTLVALIFLTGAVSAQTSSLVFTDATSGQCVEFTPFGTLVYQPQHIVSAAWRINYEDRSGSYFAYYFNGQLNADVVPVSLTANFPTGQVLNKGQRLYVRVVMRTADGKLRITRRFSWDAGLGTINSVFTYENTSSSPVDVNNVIIWRPADPPTLPAEACPYIPPLGLADVSYSNVNIGGRGYVRTGISFTTAPLQPTQSRDVPTAGCDGQNPERPPRDS